jgi:SAM-dependent methyltransferase
MSADAMTDIARFEAFEVAGWEACAADYTERLAPMTARLASVLLDAVDVGPGDRILDVGAGPGDVTAAAADRGVDATGCDVAPAMVALVEARHPGSAFVVADASSLPFADATFDAAVANVLLLHLGRPAAAVAEAVRVLVPGGRFACTVYDLPSRARVVGDLLDAVADIGLAVVPPLPPGPGLFDLSDPQALADLLAEAGLADVSVETVAFEHDVRDADELWDALALGTVRAGATLRAQPADRRERMLAAFRGRVERHRRGERLAVPASFLLASGIKAGDGVRDVRA